MVDNMFFWIMLLASLIAANNSNDTASDFGPLEVDLIFPRNNTYAPTQLLPIVFATRKPGNLTRNTIMAANVDFKISRLGDDPNKTFYDEVDLKPYGDDKGVEFSYQGFLNASVEGTWVFSYRVSWVNCTALSQVQDGDTIGLNALYENTVTFTTKNGAQPLDLTAAFNKDTCARSQSVTAQIDFLQTIPDGYTGAGHYCSVMKDAAPPLQSCNVVLSPERADAIMKRLNESICDPNEFFGRDGGKTHCYQYNQNQKSGAVYLHLFSMFYFALPFGWLLWLV